MSEKFQGAQILSFESRMADTMSRAIALQGGRAVSAPSLEEVPLSANTEALALGEKLLSGGIDVFIFMTGVGASILIDALATRHPREKIIEAIRRTTVVSRGPKPARVLKEAGIPATLMVPEPNTWVEIVQALDFSSRSVALSGRTVAIQEYGVSNLRLIDALKKRGAEVLSVPVYRWALPRDTKPLLEGIRQLIDGKIQAVLFTNAEQVRNVIGFASEKGFEKPLREALRKTIVAAVGPTTGEALAENNLSVDFEPSRPKIGILVSELAAQLETLIDRKNRPSTVRAELVEARKSPRTLRQAQGERGGLHESNNAVGLRDAIFLKACRREPTEGTPVWLMRQSGRYMKEYQENRRKVPFLELCKNKDLAAEVTIQAVQKIKADAAIIFSDILLVVEPLGLELEYTAQEGPVISGQVESGADVDRLGEIDPESLKFVFDAVRTTRAALSPKIPLIGFSGAPFTLASYVIEGGGSKTFLQTKRLMYNDPGAWHALLEKISRGLIGYLNGQIEAGADAVQIFDSWVGCLGPEDYRTYVLPHTQAVIRALHPGVPVIHFGTGTGTFLSDFREAGGDLIGVDFRIELDEAWKTIGEDVGIQGNLDPAVLCGPRPVIRDKVKKILAQAAGRPGHIFNLGHGILPQTPVENVVALVDYVHEMSRKPVQT